MSKSLKRNFNAEVEQILFRLLTKHQEEELSLHQLTRLAIGKVDNQMLDGVREKAVEQFFGRILRSTSFTDAYGDEVRKYHSYKKFTQTEDGKEVQLDIWRTIESMSPAQMTFSARARLQHADAIKARVAVDVRYWDEHVAPAINAKPISKQLGLSLSG